MPTGGEPTRLLKLSLPTTCHVLPFLNRISISCSRVVSRNAAEMAAHAKSFDLILNTVAAPHELDPFLALLKRDGTLTLVGAPASPHPIIAIIALGGEGKTSLLCTWMNEMQAAGWHVCNIDQVNLHAAVGVAIREFPLAAGFGFADYLLYVGGKACGVIEAKKQGATLTGVELQSGRYAQGLPATLPAWSRPLPFVWESTGVETHFTNGLDPEPRARAVFAFFRPELLVQWLALLPPAATRSSTGSGVQYSRERSRSSAGMSALTRATASRTSLAASSMLRFSMNSMSTLPNPSLAKDRMDLMPEMPLI